MKRLAIIVLALGAGACGASGPSSTTAGGAGKSFGAAAFRYSACIRQHGVPDFPDPHVTTTPGGGVKISQGVPASAGLAPRFRAAQKACQGILPPPGNGPDEGHRQVKKQVLLAFAHCLRGHGVSDFPDPTSQGQLSLQMISAAGVDLRAPSFMTAARACVGVTHGVVTMADVAVAARGGH
jgi:hypothetical protein